MQPKPIWKSKTFWFNILSGVLEVGQVVSGLNIIPPGTIAVAAALINIVLRRITNTPTTFTAPKEIS